MQLSHFAFNIKCICFEIKVFWPATSSAIDIEVELIGNYQFSGYLRNQLTMWDMLLCFNSDVLTLTGLFYNIICWLVELTV